MRFFLLAPYDFGASSKIIKNGVIFSVKFPFKITIFFRSKTYEFNVALYSFLFFGLLKSGDFSLCGNAREREVKCERFPQNAGGLATML